MGGRGRLIGLAVAVAVAPGALGKTGPRAFAGSSRAGVLTPAGQYPVTRSPSRYPDMGTDPVSLAFSPDGGLLATANAGANDVLVFRVNARSGALRAAASALTGMEPGSVAFSPRGGLLVAANQDSTLSVFTVNLSSGVLTPTPQSELYNAGSGPGPVSIAFSPGGTLLAAASQSADSVSVFKIDRSTDALTPVTQSPAANADTGPDPKSVAFSPGGGLLATANQDGTLSVFKVNPSSGALAPVRQSPAPRTVAFPSSMAFSPRGGLLATANPGAVDVSVFTVNAATGALRLVRQVRPANAQTGLDPESVAFSPGGGLLATANLGDDTVSVFKVNPSSGALSRVKQSPAANADTGYYTNPISLAFSPRGGLLATADYGSATVSVFKLVGS